MGSREDLPRFQIHSEVSLEVMAKAKKAAAAAPAMKKGRRRAMKARKAMK